jgi:CRISPR-associated protein Cmr4
MTQATALMGLICETSLHAGAGSSISAIDLPIQREGHNGWPCVFGSAVKGALRSRAEDGIPEATRQLIFGPDTNNASDHAGALMVGDARLLLLPVRSLTTAFKWVTCPEALHRLNRDARRMGLEATIKLETIPEVTGDHALAPEGDGTLYLEDNRFDLQPDANLKALIPTLAGLVNREGMDKELQQRLILVGNDAFAHLAASATPVNAHIALDSDTKTVSGTALWYEETLPPETVLYAPLQAVKARKKDSQLEAADVLKLVSDLFAEKPWLQLGGNETVGMGWCAVKFLSRGA